jgi:hypothetical protein
MGSHRFSDGQEDGTGGSMTSHPYARKYVPDSHPVAEHILIAEKALGKKLPPGVEIHHVNELKKDNRPENFVICPDHAYHALLHRRQKAFDASGHYDWVKCCHCKTHDDPKNLTVTVRFVSGNKTQLAYHKDCNTKAHRAYLNRKAN